METTAAGAGTRVGRWNSPPPVRGHVSADGTHRRRCRTRVGRWNSPPPVRGHVLANGTHCRRSGDTCRPVELTAAGAGTRVGRSPPPVQGHVTADGTHRRRPGDTCRPMELTAAGAGTRVGRLLRLQGRRQLAAKYSALLRNDRATCSS